MSSLSFQAPIPVVRNVNVCLCGFGVEDLRPGTFICCAVMSCRNIHMNVSHHGSKMLMILCFFVFLLDS